MPFIYDEEKTDPLRTAAIDITEDDLFLNRPVYGSDDGFLSQTRSETYALTIAGDDTVLELRYGNEVNLFVKTVQSPFAEHHHLKLGSGEATHVAVYGAITDLRKPVFELEREGVIGVTGMFFHWSGSLCDDVGWNENRPAISADINDGLLADREQPS